MKMDENSNYEPKSEPRYLLVDAGKLEALIRNNNLLSHSVLVFEYLLEKANARCI